MTERFKEFIKRVLQHEGGYVDDPDDRGGATKYGVIQRTLDYYNKLENDLEMPASVRDLTTEQAKRVYWALYWNKYYDEIEEKRLAFKVFDIGINIGVRTAVKKLQLVLSRHGADLKIDGIFGPKTLHAVNNSIKSLYEAYKTAIEHYYNHIVAVDKTQRKFLKGWLNRLEYEYTG